jgi:hypothetical protein
MDQDTRDIEFLRSLSDEALLSMFGHGAAGLSMSAKTSRAQAARAKKKSGPFDSKVRSILQNIETRRGPVPARGRATLVASAILRDEGGNVESIRRQVRRSLERQGLR